MNLSCFGFWSFVDLMWRVPIKEIESFQLHVTICLQAWVQLCVSFVELGDIKKHEPKEGSPYRVMLTEWIITVSHLSKSESKTWKAAQTAPNLDILAASSLTRLLSKLIILHSVLADSCGDVL